MGGIVTWLCWKMDAEVGNTMMAVSFTVIAILVSCHVDVGLHGNTHLRAVETPPHSHSPRMFVWTKKDSRLHLSCKCYWCKGGHNCNVDFLELSIAAAFMFHFPTVALPLTNSLGHPFGCSEYVWNCAYGEHRRVGWWGSCEGVQR